MGPGDHVLRVQTTLAEIIRISQALADLCFTCTRTTKTSSISLCLAMSTNNLYVCFGPLDEHRALALLCKPFKMHVCMCMCRHDRGVKVLKASGALKCCMLNPWIVWQDSCSKHSSRWTWAAGQQTADLRLLKKAGPAQPRNRLAVCTRSQNRKIKRQDAFSTNSGISLHESHVKLRNHECAARHMQSRRARKPSLTDAKLCPVGATPCIKRAERVHDEVPAWPYLAGIRPQPESSYT